MKLKGQIEAYLKVDVDSGIWTSLAVSDDYLQLTDDFEPEWQALFVAGMKLLGCTGEWFILSTWDGWQESCQEWEPLEIAQYVWQNGTDDATDVFYKDNVAIGEYYASRGAHRLESYTTRQVWWAKEDGKGWA